jgi:hypothetical protein
MWYFLVPALTLDALATSSLTTTSDTPRTESHRRHDLSSISYSVRHIAHCPTSRQILCNVGRRTRNFQGAACIDSRSRLHSAVTEVQFAGICASPLGALCDADQMLGGDMTHGSSANHLYVDLATSTRTIRTQDGSVGARLSVVA